ncbi:MAG: CopD family protein [Methylomonas sp.]
MIWLLLLHISAVLCWCGSLLYLPALVAGTAYRQTDMEQEHQQALMLLVYRLFATPAALIAVASGTVLFITRGVTEQWLMLKLLLVTLLVMCHALIGWLMLTQKMSGKSIKLSCLMLRLGAAVLIPAIVGLVLVKPVWELAL